MKYQHDISIIIPVFNTGKYLSECLDSLLNQGLENYEIIIIDDGSTDNSAEIIEKYSNSYSNIINIYQKNNGQGSARNKGLKIAQGEYIYFSVLTIGLFVWTIYKYSDYYLLSVLLLVFIGAWHGSFNGIRQYLACAILFAGHRYILKRDFWKYFLIVILASTFHISALVMILLYFVPRESITIKQSVILIVVIVLGLTGYEYIFNTIDSFLQASDRSVVAIGDYLLQELSIFRILVMVAPPTLYLFLAPKNVMSDEDHFYVNMLFLNAALYIITARSAYLARFTIYTNIYITLGFPRIFKGTDKKTSAFIIYIAMILFSIYWGYEILLSDNLNNFQWIFER